MHELTFYRQQRQDGGVRTGIELDNSETLLIDFQEGPADRQGDPLGAALTWYVDLRCRGEDLPTKPEPARLWFLSHREAFRDGLEELADRLAAGTDDSFPIRWEDFRNALGDAEAEIVCSATRRLGGRELADNLREVGSQLGEYLQVMAPLDRSSRGVGA